MSLRKVVAITGCDSGLGWAIAARSAREGLVTVAGMFRGTDTEAAQALKRLNAHPCPLDVTSRSSIAAFKQYVDSLLRDNPSYTLHAVVNNAGMMIIGDYEWQTADMVSATIDVNLNGAMSVTSAFLPDLRRQALTEKSAKPRIVNIASHCGLQPLPGFSSYSASKAGLLAFTEALRYEQGKHGLQVVAFIPGGFAASSHILANQAVHGKNMIDHLDAEQRGFYSKKITALVDYLQKAVPQNSDFDSMKDVKILETFMKTITEDRPKEFYKVESWRYKIYYNLLKLPFPECIKNWLIKRFTSFPDS